MKRLDCLVIGAGLAGASAARSLAEQGKKVLVLERREHVGGSAFDCTDDAGVLIHQYGPHIFHTDNSRVYEFLSRFTRWRAYSHQVIADIPGEDGRMTMPVPFNLVSLEAAFGAEKAAALEQKLTAAYGYGNKVTILQLRQDPDPEIAALAQYVYDHVFVKYTMKQWGQAPEEIDPDTTARVPVVLSRDCRYFQDAYQGIPAAGYTAMVEAMLDHPDISLELGVNAGDRLALTEAHVTLDGEAFCGMVIYTGAVDELFGLEYGRLPYRTLDFRFETLEREFFQTHGTVNYTMDQNFTRITEFKHLTGQIHPRTTIMREYPRPYTGAEGEVPYYAIISEENNALYERYRARAEAYGNLILLGRMAEYKYYNMDAIVARALEVCDGLRQ